MISWDDYPNFTKEEFDCSHTGENHMNPVFLERLQAIRHQFNRPFIITSGYRDTTHPVEAKKAMRGEHTYGCAADIAIRGPEALRLVNMAYEMGIRRIGINQKGKGRFVHLGMGDELAQFPSSVWSY